MEAMDKIRDEMAKAKNPAVETLGEWMTAWLGEHPEGGEKVLAEKGWNVSSELLAAHLACMEQTKLEEGKSATHDAMQKLPKWRRIVKRTNREKGQVAAALRKLLGL